MPLVQRGAIIFASYVKGITFASPARSDVPTKILPAAALRVLMA